MTFPADDTGDRDEAMPSPQEGTPAEQEASQQETAARAAMEELLRIDHQLPFGPRFFLVQLAAFVRDRCPETSERLPHVEAWDEKTRLRREKETLGFYVSGHPLESHRRRR